MGHPTIDEFCRIHTLPMRPEFVRRCQREFRDDVTPKLDRIDALEAENAILREQLEKTAKAASRRKDGEAVSA